MQKMASKEIILFLMVSFHFCYPASLLPLGKNSTSVACNFKPNDTGSTESSKVVVPFLPLASVLDLFRFPARLQENLGEKETDEHKLGDEKVIAHRSNFAAGVGGRGGRGGGGSRGEGGSGEEGNGGSSTTPNTGAGTAVVPLYAAGANGHRNNHHGSASSNRSCVGLSALCAVILASLVVHVYKVLGSENLV